MMGRFSLISGCRCQIFASSTSFQCIRCMSRFFLVVPRPVPTISRTVVSFAAVYTDWQSGSMFISFTHVWWSGWSLYRSHRNYNKDNSAQVATFTTSWTYNSVLQWIRRLVAGPVLEVPGRGSDAFFFALVAPGPLPLTGALLDLLVVPLHSGGSWWSLFWLLTGGAFGGPPVCVVGAVGPGPCGILSADPEGQPWALLSLSFLGPLRMVFSLLPSLGWWLLLWLCSHIVCFGWYESSLDIFGGDWFIQIIWSIPLRFVVSLIGVCCFIRCLILMGTLRCSSFSGCWCWSSAFYTMVCWLSVGYWCQM